ncbi:hypothetical protein IKW72_08650 [bacterium]|nr:hypothetical protein [bacterium]
MKKITSIIIIVVFIICGCNNSQFDAPENPSQSISEREKTPDEILGLKEPGRLAASVEAWAKSNELGDYFRQSRDRLAKLRAQLIEDYKVRTESDLEPTSFTRETLGKYNETYDVDAALVKFMVECYSRKEVRPLPQNISRHFTTAMEDRGKMREIIKEAPNTISRLENELETFKLEVSNIGSFSWSQEKELNDWKEIQQKINDVFSRSGKANSQAAALLANLEKATENDMSEQTYNLRDQADHLKSDLSSFYNHITQQLEIVNGQILLTSFSDNCKAIIEGTKSVPIALDNKKKRMAEIKELISQLTSSRSRGYSDLASLDQQAASLKSRSQKEGQDEISLGNRIQKLARNYQNVFGSSAIYRLKKELPEESACAQIDTCLANFKRSINASPNADLSSAFTNLESKAYQLSDRMEEEALLKRMDETLNSVKKLAARARQ